MKSFVMWALWIALAAIWGQTLFAEALINSNLVPLALATVALALFYVLYFAEGLELAVADLRDKDVDQISDESTRNVLAEMKERSQFFFSQRQIFVVAIITYVTLTLDYEALYVWPIGWVHDATAKFLFGLLFVTLTILWFCQVTPKRLAIINSELFLRQSLFVWPLVKLVGSLGLVAPVEQIVGASRKLFGFTKDRRLAPSLSQSFCQNFDRLGVAIDSLMTAAKLNADGTLTITRRSVIVCGHGEIDQFGGVLHAGLSNVTGIRSINMRPTFLGTTEIGESLHDAYDALDRLGAGETTGVSGISENRLSELIYETSAYVDDRDATLANWSIKFNASLPEGLVGGDLRQGKIAVVVIEVTMVCNAAVFAATGQDYWLERIDMPTRRYAVSLTADASADFVPVLKETTVGLNRMSSPFPVEQQRISRSLAADLSGKKARFIAFPAQGAVYRTAVDYLYAPRADSDQPYLPGIEETVRTVTA